MVIMASGIARMRVDTATTTTTTAAATESRNMAAITPKEVDRHKALVYCVLLWY